MAQPTLAARRTRLLAGALAFVLALGLGCATRGSKFDVDKLPLIEEGVTTRAQIEAWFGRPITVRSRPSGFATYRYLHEEETRHDTGFLSRIGRMVAALLGRPGVVSPVDVEYKNTVRHELVVLFNPEGIVVDSGYERTEIPSKRVY
jgi:outer membrane protein assembly factor BamE (lipoprotein component of BamABCDE complex)